MTDTDTYIVQVVNLDTKERRNVEVLAPNSLAAHDTVKELPEYESQTWRVRHVLLAREKRIDVKEGT